MKRILIACEESQAVTIKFRELGFKAYSCDLQDCTGGHPEWHIKSNVFDIIKHDWDCMIAFPPCTHLCVSGAKWFKIKRENGLQQNAIDFFLKLANAPIEKICIENPIGIMSNIYKKPTQIIQPYYFGDMAQKTTCLWLKNLPKLIHNDKPNLFNDEVTHCNKGNFIKFKSGKKMPEWYAKAYKYNSQERSKLRSKTFNGIAKAMAEQWSKII